MSKQTQKVPQPKPEWDLPSLCNLFATAIHSSRSNLLLLACTEDSQETELLRKALSFAEAYLRDQGAIPDHSPTPATSPLKGARQTGAHGWVAGA